MELTKIKSRRYLIDGNDRRKMIPIKYHPIAECVFAESKFNFDKVFLDDYERFLCEIELLKKSIQNEEPFVFELIKDKNYGNVLDVRVKFADDRYEIEFGDHSVKCSSEIFKYAPKELKGLKYSVH